jgi:peptide/nickel transport system substrate-binding protein
MKKYSSMYLTFVVVIVALVLVCSISAGAQDLRAKSLIVANSALPQSLDPAVAYDPWSTIYNSGTYETLVRAKRVGGGFEPVLATAWSSNEDGTRWIFHLRKGVKFHDGTPFNAEAVKFSIDRVMTVNKGPAWFYEPVKEIKVVDEHTVRFILKQPYAPFLGVMGAAYGSLIVSPTAAKKHATAEDPHAERWMQDHMVGTGPYMLKDWVKGQMVRLEKFDDYWGGWAGKHLDRVIVRFVQEPATQRLMLEKGEIDIANNLTLEMLDKLTGSPAVNVAASPEALNIMYVILNCKKEPTSNKLVRKAIAYAYDYDSVVKVVYGGHARRQQGPLPRIQWAFDNSLPMYTRNLMKAREYLRKAGYPEGFAMTYAYFSEGGEHLRKQAELFQSNMADVGIRVELQPMVLDPFITMGTDTAEKRTEAFSTDWYPDFDHPSTWLDNFFLSSGVFLSTLLSNAELDKVLDEARQSFDRQKQLELYKKAQHIIVEETPALFLADINYRVAMRKNVKGFKFHPLYSNIFNFYDMYLEQ